MNMNDEFNRTLKDGRQKMTLDEINEGLESGTMILRKRQRRELAIDTITLAEYTDRFKSLKYTQQLQGYVGNRAIAAINPLTRQVWVYRNGSQPVPRLKPLPDLKPDAPVQLRHTPFKLLFSTDDGALFSAQQRIQYSASVIHIEYNQDDTNNRIVTISSGGLSDTSAAFTRRYIEALWVCVRFADAVHRTNN